MRRHNIETNSRAFSRGQNVSKLHGGNSNAEYSISGNFRLRGSSFGWQEYNTPSRCFKSNSIIVIKPTVRAYVGGDTMTIRYEIK